MSRRLCIRLRLRESSDCLFTYPELTVYLILSSSFPSGPKTGLAQKTPSSFIHAIISSLLLLSAMFAGVWPATVGVSQ